MQATAAAAVPHEVVPPELPLAGDVGAIPGILQDVGEGELVFGQDSPLGVVTSVVATGHQLHPRRRAQRHGVGVGEAQTRLSKAIEAGGVVRGSAVRAQGLVAEVVDKDQDDVGAHRKDRRGEQQRCDEDSMGHCSTAQAEAAGTAPNAAPRSLEASGGKASSTRSRRES